MIGTFPEQRKREKKQKRFDHGHEGLRVIRGAYSKALHKDEGSILI